MIHTRRLAGRMTAVLFGFMIGAPIGSSYAAPPNAGPATSANAIRLSTATFRPGLGERAALPPGLSISRYAKGQRGYYIVQFSGPVQPAWRISVEDEGAEILEYIPDFAFKVRMNPGQAKRVAEQEEISWVGIFQPAYKLRPAMRDGEAQLYRVRLNRGVDASVTHAEVLATGARAFGGSGMSFVIEADASQLEAVARVLDVAWIETFSFREKHNEYASAIVGADTSHSNGYDGSGQIVAIADTGIGAGTAAGAHPGIDASRIVAIRDWVGVSDDPTCYEVIDDGPHDVDSGHGTHVAMSAVGAGAAGGEGGGTAPGAGLVFQAVENLTDFVGICSQIYADGYYLFGIPFDIRDLFQQAYDDGARIHSDSWGTPSNPGAYDIDSFYADEFIWSHPDMTITNSAGNSGDDFDHDGYADTAVTSGPNERYYLSTPATAKNLITVGASENDRQGHYECDPVATSCDGVNEIFTYGWAWPLEFDIGPTAGDLTAGNAEQMAAFSSRGPTQDNRIKPDVVAPGTWILSGYSDMYQQFYDPSPNPNTGLWQSGGWFDPLDAEYKYFGGTSMSTPLVAGAAAVVRQYYQSVFGHNASAALVKATLINSAVDLLDENNDGLNDNAIPIPNNHEGWGRIDLDAATDGSHTFEEESAWLQTGSSASYQYNVATAGSALKVSLVWSDYPSSEAALTNLVNDLDLNVMAPGGAAYSGNNFSGGWSQTGGTADRTNNLENVYVEAAAAGQWTVIVSGYNVPNGPQPFALVVDVADAGSVDTPPLVTVTNPPDSAIVMGTVTIDASASDDDAVSQVEFSIDSNSIDVDSDGSDGWSMDWDTTTVSDGVYTITATAMDTASQTRSDSVGVTVDNIQPPPVSTIHVTDLEGSSANAGRGRWTATATIVIGDGGGSSVDGAFVEGNWGGGANGGDSCTTGADGSCQVSKDVRNKFADASFSVTGVTQGSATYQPGSNTDADGDSDGTTVVISKDGGGSEPPPPPPSGDTMHIGDLEISSSSAPRNRWSATVTVVVHTSIALGDGLLSGMTVSGSWSSGGGGNCTTGPDGSCTIVRNNIKGNVASTTFSVTDVVDPSVSPIFGYAAVENHDADGDSDGNAMSVNKP
jgi:subtilisin family serine protease